MKHGKFEEQHNQEPVLGLPAEEKTASGKKMLLKDIMVYLHDWVFLLGIGFVVLLLCFKIVVVSGTSMKNTLLDGDYLLLISSSFYKDPQYGDIIVASKDSYENGAPIVKRVIATLLSWPPYLVTGAFVRRPDNATMFIACPLLPGRCLLRAYSCGS